MAIELDKDARKEAAGSIARYVEENQEALSGTLGATQLLDFILEEIGPSIYNRAVSDVQTRLQARLADLEAEVFEDEFQYWRRLDRLKRKK